jgi:hypothetical protein
LIVADSTYDYSTLQMPELRHWFAATDNESDCATFFQKVLLLQHQEKG